MPTSGVADIRVWLESRIGAGVRLGLSTCSEMLERLGNPQADFPSIHVAGTNGKGSLCAHLSANGMACKVVRPGLLCRPAAGVEKLTTNANL